MNAIIYNKFGKILRTVSAPIEYLIAQKQESEFILFGTANDATQYIDLETAEIRDIPTKPNDYSEFNWQTKQWDALADWLDKAKADTKTEINNLTSAKILSKYPDYRQRNMTARYLKLVTLAETETEEALTIHAAWNWIKDIRSRSNTATALLETKTTLSEIQTVVSDYTTELGNIS